MNMIVSFSGLLAAFAAFLYVLNKYPQWFNFNPHLEADETLVKDERGRSNGNE